MSTPLLVADLEASYKESEHIAKIFRAVSFQVNSGEVLGVFGPNGCGKSTLLNILSGIATASSGSVTLSGNGQNNHNLAMIPQDYRSSFFDWADLCQNVQLTLANPVANWRRNLGHIAEVRKQLGLDLDLRLHPFQCSGGMLQQAAILRAFVGNPNVLLADEPFSALDVSVSKTVRRAFVHLIKSRGIATVLVLHSPEEIVEMCDRVLVIPGIPFSTTGLDGFEFARILQNPYRTMQDREQVSVSLVSLVERMLATKA